MGDALGVPCTAEGTAAVLGAQGNQHVSLIWRVALICIVAACSAPAPAPTQPAPARTQAQATSAGTSSSDWQSVVQAAKQEGQVVWHITSDTEPLKAVAKAFEQEYGIRVVTQVIPSPDFLARLQAERAVGKVTADVSSSGSARRWDEDGYGESLGQLPTMGEPLDTWVLDPFQDIREGRSNVPIVSVDPNYMLANEQLCPPENCPKSYQELGDPRWKGLLLINDPSASSTGSFILGYLYEQYGEELIKGIFANTKALTRSNIDQERQVARGEFALSVMGKAPESTWQLPPPRPLRIIVPSDGMIPTIGGLNLLKGAPHPNAARVFINFQFTQAGQQARAGAFGGTFVRKGVIPVEPAIIQMGDKWFPKFSLADTQAYTVRYVNYTPIYDKYMKEYGLK